MGNSFFGLFAQHRQNLHVKFADFGIYKHKVNLIFEKKTFFRNR
jgi:hypothetical protein